MFAIINSHQSPQFKSKLVISPFLWFPTKRNCFYGDTLFNCLVESNVSALVCKTFVASSSNAWTIFSININLILFENVILMQWHFHLPNYQH